MAMGKIKIICNFLLTLFSTAVFCQRTTNHAILIGVDTYKYPNVWNSPPQLKKNIEEVSNFFRTSKRYGFRLTALVNKDVYVEKIKQTLEHLDVSKGDYVMIYLTGHGCQVEDKSGKRKNAMHQGFICYDTPDKQHKDFTKTVLLGDSLGVWLTDLRKRLGSAGQVFILVESCHSGGITRGRKNKQAQFIEENIVNLKDRAPLIVFASSRAFNQTSSIQKFTTIFLSAFRNFTEGSYYDLFGQFYLAQRKEILSRSDIQLAVNLDVDDPNYLRMGVFQDSIYAPNNFIRIIEISPDYEKDHQFKIDRGVFEGVTQGSTIKLTDADQKKFAGNVDIATNGSSWVTLTGNSFPLKSDLWKYQVQIADYHFRDTLFISIDSLVSNSFHQKVREKLTELRFVKLDTAGSFNGYTLISINDSLFIRRNKDTTTICQVQDIDDLKSSLVKISISRFIRQLRTTKDSSVSLALQYNKVPLSDNELAHLNENDSLVIVVHSIAIDQERYYCLLHLQDEFISQIVPVNFQVNESECKLPRRLDKDILIGGVKVGKTDGSFLLVISETPFDLRQILLKPFSKTRGKLNKMEKLINDVFLNERESNPLYNPDALKIEQRNYKIERMKVMN